MTPSELGEDRLGSAGDDLYATLLDAHRGLSDTDSQRLNARLILILMNVVGDRATIEGAIERARRGLGEPSSDHA